MNTKTLVAALFVALFSSVAFSATLELSWNDNSTNEDGFSIERSIDGGDWIEIGQTGPDESTFTDNTVPLASEVRYRVLAFNTYGNSGYSNTVTESTNPPDNPDGLLFRRIAAAVAFLLFVFGKKLIKL